MMCHVQLKPVSLGIVCFLFSLFFLPSISPNSVLAKDKPLAGDQVRGEQLWLDHYACNECHGPENDKEEPNPPADAVVRGFYDRSEMMSILEDISEQEMADIRAYLRTLD